MKSMPEEKKKTWIRKHPVLAGVFGFFLLLIVIGIFQGIGNGITSNSISEGIQKEILPASYEEAEQKAVSVSYEDLMRYSESYEGKWVCFEGEVVQVVSDIPNMELRISTKKDEWIGYLEDVVYLYSGDYSGERLLEGDLIQFCGKSTGILIYEAVLGNQMSIPKIETDELYVKRIN